MRIGRAAAVVAPVLLAGVLFAVALRLGDPRRALGAIRGLPPSTLAAALGCAVVYLALKAWQLRMLLRNVGIRADWKRLSLAFAVGELALTLPFGLFAQNWVLARTGRASFGESAAATVVMLLVEVVVVLLFLAFVGIGGWPAARPGAVVALVGLCALMAAVLRFESTLRALGERLRGRRLTHRALVALIDLLCGLQRLSRLHVLVVNAAVAAAYLGALALAFMIVGQHVGLEQFGFVMAATTYAFALAVVFLTGGLVSQIGTIEVLGMSAAQAAFGVSYAEGLTLMLAFRVVWTGAMWVCNLPVVALLWRA